MLPLYASGAGIFLTVNRTDGGGRKRENISSIRGVWRENDSGCTTALPLEPSLIVESSPGKFHEYILASDHWPADEQGSAEHRAIEERMIESYGSDPNAKDLCRVLRVPGFLHRKDKNRPHLVRVVSSPGWRYPRQQIVEALPPVESAKKTEGDRQLDKKASEHPKAADDGEDRRIREALFSIDATERHVWLTIGMALEAHYGRAGRALWDEWSATATDKHDPADQDRVWDSFKGSGIGIGTLFHYARHGGWEDHTEKLYEEWCRKQKHTPGDDGRTSTEGQARLPTIVSSGEFVANFVPPDYLVDGLIQEGFLYSLTGATGAGKTCITLRLAASTALGAIFANRETKKARVLYLAAENPDDVRMRWKALAQQMDFLPEENEVYFIEGTFRISEMIDRVKSEIARVGGEFGLVVVDTGPVFYEGDDENNRKQQGDHAELMRSLITLVPGRPAVLVNCHPVKNASPDNLLPAGGGNFLNQVDGNLTAAKTESTTALHWQGKFRGVEFAPMYFLIKTVTHQELKDSKGRLIPTVICEPISDRRQEELEKQADADDLRILKYVAQFPRASLTDIAAGLGWTLFSGGPNKSRAQRAIKRLTGERLLKKSKQGFWIVTKEGKEALDTGS